MNICRSYSEQFDSGFVWRLLFILCSIALITTASDAFASGDPVGSVLCNMIKTFRGNTARGIAIIGVVVLGIQTLRGQLKWEIALVTVTGVIILFKAPDIITLVGGAAAADTEACKGT
ncbi:TrbC/VirB2 family protein [Candidatus Tisiphia endosymbiont of Micropterix aruncella]|uniref:TrbC/VirB2 family protein n=1 Tax=Candidatus Tisiphia endosymbiont of Micropterix aruncella TaxID=3066271 RepID=UPI003AA8C796